MKTVEVTVFFYGLFMDSSLLASYGIEPSRVELGRVEGFGLRIGERATLLRRESENAYGQLMSVNREALEGLYSNSGVSDYVAEDVSVILSDGKVETALCYNLPEHKLRGTNDEYARSLFRLAQQLGLPHHYVQQIGKQAGS